MAEDRVEDGTSERAGRVLASRLDKPHPSSHVAALFKQPLGGAFQHGWRWIDDRDVVASACERNALVSGSATNVHDAPRKRSQVLPKVRVDDVRSDAPAQRAVVLVHEALG